MTRLILAIYDYFAKHRWLAALTVVATVVVAVLLSFRLKYGENIADFLPQSEENGRYTKVYNQLGDQGRVTVIFRQAEAGEPEAVMEAMELFDEMWATGGETDSGVVLECRVDESRVLDAMDAIGENIAIHLTQADYDRIDSLLARQGYIDTCLENIRQMLAFPMSGMALQAISADPLNLFSPALQRLSALGFGEKYSVEEGFVMDSAGNGYAFIHVPFASSDTRAYGRLSKQIEAVCDSVESQMPEVRISAVGAGLIAATNASQIKRDSIIGLVIASVFIMAILMFTMGRKRNIVWLAASVAVGWLFALGVIALVKPSLSVIVIGIGSVLIGIAVNYPLHYLDHIRDHTDKRASLKEMVEPLVTGNITTVSAFACLMFVKAEAMRDLGLFGALMLVGTIVVVMVWLPHVAASGKRKSSDGKESMPHAEQSGTQSLNHSDTQTLRHSSNQKLLRTVAFVLVVVLTVVFGWLSTKTQFDADLHNINYMTAQQREDLRLLSGEGEKRSEKSVIYVVSEGESLDSALVANERLMESLKGYKVSGVDGLLPSTVRQDESWERWQSFCENNGTLAETVRRKAAAMGFADGAFEPFYERMELPYEVWDIDKKEPEVADLCTGHIIKTDKGVSIVSFVEVDSSEAQKTKAMIREAAGESNFAFDVTDVGSNLVNDLQDDFNYILYVCGFVVFFFLWLSLGRIELAILSFIPLAVGWLWILGMMDIAGVKFNIVNIILATFIFGQGDDYTIFITEGLMYEYAYGKKRLRSYRRSVIISAALMFVGIGVLVFAKHPAMRSLGEVAVIGMFTVILMACYLPPLIFRWLTMKRGVRMEVPITFERLVYTVYVLGVMGVVSMLIVSPLTWVYRLVCGNGERAQLNYHRFLQFMMKVGLKMLPKVKTSVENPHGERFVKPAVIVANHRSHLDLEAVLMLHPKIVVLTNDWVWHDPLYGVVIRYAQFYPVSKGYEQLVPKLRNLTERGYSVMVFPEGTRSMDGKIGRMHKGAFQLAKELGVDILPLYIHGAGDVMPKSDILLREGRITVEIGERMGYDSFCDTDAQTIASNMRTHYEEQMARMAEQIEDERYFIPYVRYQYLYKGRDIYRRCRKALKAYEGQAPEVSGQGEVALLRALAHKGTEYHVRFENEDDYLVASNVNRLPANLHYELKSEKETNQ
jgi:1-acyl-sn-glycerol-3-phosphate acyltransferase